jgi:hypothetical protein
MMKKSKSGFSIPAELHFISSLPIEEAARLMQGLAAPDTKVTLGEITADMWYFAIDGYLPGQKDPVITIAGTLRRWQGTLTRLNGSSSIRHPALPPALRGALPILWGILSMGLVVLIDALVSSTLALILLAVIMAVVFAVFFYGAVQAAALDKPTEQKRDQIFEAINSSFKLAGDVSGDDADMDTSDDPGVDQVLAMLQAERERTHVQQK